MRKKTFIFTAGLSLFVLVAVVILFNVNAPDKPELSEADKILYAFDSAAQELGYEFSSLEKIRTPLTYSDTNGNTIVFNSFYCSDPERIENEEVSFFTEVFDPQTADSTRDIEVNGENSMLCTKEGRSYLIWYPNAYTILMLDYDPDIVTEADILRMAESCE